MNTTLTGLISEDLITALAIMGGLLLVLSLLLIRYRVRPIVENSEPTINNSEVEKAFIDSVVRLHNRRKRIRRTQFVAALLRKPKIVERIYIMHFLDEWVAKFSVDSKETFIIYDSHRSLLSEKIIMALRLHFEKEIEELQSRVAPSLVQQQETKTTV